PAPWALEPRHHALRDIRQRDLQRPEVLVRVPGLRYQRATRSVGQFGGIGRALYRKWLSRARDEPEREVPEIGCDRCVQPGVLELLGGRWLVCSAALTPGRIRFASGLCAL